MAILTNYKRPAKVNPYADDVKALIQAGEGAAYELIGLTDSVEGKRVKTYSGEKAKFQDAVREAGYSARQVEVADLEDGNTRGVFILGAERKRTPKDSAKADKPSK